MNTASFSSLLDKLPPLFMRTSHCYPLPFSANSRYYSVLSDLFKTSLLRLEGIHNNLTHLELKKASCSSYVDYISVLETVRDNLLIFVSQVYKQAEKLTNPELEVAEILSSINQSFLRLEQSVDVSKFAALSSVKVESFAKIKDDLNENRDATMLRVIKENGRRMDSYLVLMLSKYRVKKSIPWKYYACGAIGLSLFAFWLLRRRHGSVNDETSFIETLSNLCTDHVKTPLKAIKDELLKRNTKFEDEPKELITAKDHLERSLQEYPGNRFAEKDERYQHVLDSLPKQFEHPLTALWEGLLAKGLVIKLQRLFVDVETGKHAINTFLRNNGLNIALWSAFPVALLLYVGTYALSVCSTLCLDARELNRNTCRFLLKDVERRINDYLKEEKKEKLEKLHGLSLYELNKFYQSIEKHARSTREWEHVKRNLVLLGTSDREHKETIMLRSINDLQVGYKCTALAQQSLHPLFHLTSSL